MGAEDFKQNNEVADRMSDATFGENMQKLEELKGKQYPDDFKDSLKSTQPQLYEEVIKLDANKDSIMVLSMVLDDLDSALSKMGTNEAEETGRTVTNADGTVDVGRFDVGGNFVEGTRTYPQSGIVQTGKFSEDGHLVDGTITYPNNGGTRTIKEEPKAVEPVTTTEVPATPDAQVAGQAETAPAAPEAPEKKVAPKITREKFMEENKDLSSFSKIEGDKLTVDFKGNKDAERLVQIQDLFKDATKELTKKSPTGLAVKYTWNADKNPPSFYSGDYRMQIKSGDVITISDKVADKASDKQPEKPEDAKMRESLAAKFGVDASKLTDGKIVTANGEAMATYNYERNGQKFQLEFNLAKNIIRVIDDKGKTLDSATATASKERDKAKPKTDENGKIYYEAGNIQIDWLIDEIQKDQGIDVKDKSDEKPEEKYEVINQQPKVEATADGYILMRQSGITFGQDSVKFDDKPMQWIDEGPIKVKNEDGKLVITETETTSGLVNVYEGKNGKEIMDSMRKKAV